MIRKYYIKVKNGIAVQSNSVQNWFSSVCDRYIKRVEADDGTIQGDFCRVIHYLINNNMWARCRRLYQAAAGMELDGNKVDKWHNSSGEKEIASQSDHDQTFTGTDRPEKHVTLQGAHQVSVEKEAKNVAPNSWLLGTPGINNLPNHYGKFESGDIEYELIERENKPYMFRCEVFAGGGRIHIRPGIFPYVVETEPDEYYTISCVIHEALGSTDRFLWFARESQSGVGLPSFNGFDPNGEFPQFVWITLKSHSTSNESIFRIGKGTNNTTSQGRTVFSDINIVKGKYPVLPIKTDSGAVTRLAPEPRFTNFLPTDQATIAGWCDLVYDPENPTRIFDTAGNGNTHRSLLGIQNIGGVPGISARIFGTDGGQTASPLPFSVGDYERILFGYAISYNDSQFRIWLLLHTGEMYTIFSNNVINDTSETDIYIGARDADLQTSTRHEVAPGVHPYTDNDQTIKNLLSSLSRYEGGANLSPDQIEIQ